ncbi:DNA cytosine methyltransferase [Streptomyces sp. SID14478]|nr:DNA cytosine methyltransferase [Streptomyces sp. SID14478]
MSPGAEFTSFEICAGSGAQALGLEKAGFQPVLLLDTKAHACWTIELNRPQWKVLCGDLLHFDPADHPEVYEVDLFSGGMPRIKSAAAVKRPDDELERAVLRHAVDLVPQIRPKAVLLENLPDLVEKGDYEAERAWMEAQLREAGYRVFWKVLDAADFGVPQHRRSGFLVALQEPSAQRFVWPSRTVLRVPTVGDVLGSSMAQGGWPGAERWAHLANRPAPALVGGSDRRGGADLGPTGSKRAWAQLGVNGNSLDDEVPGMDFPLSQPPKLTVAQTAILQAIPASWQISGGKTAAYRQIGNALPPPVAHAVGTAIVAALAG